MRTTISLPFLSLVPVCVVALLAGCRSSQPTAAAPPSPPGLEPSDPAPTPTSPAAPVVRTASEPLTLAAWVEPAHLPPGGGRVTVIVRVRLEGGRPYPGVEVRLAASRGTLASEGRVLVTDAKGQVRDRLETRRTASLTVNAGGTVYRFPVPVLPASADPGTS